MRAFGRGSTPSVCLTPRSRCRQRLRSCWALPAPLAAADWRMKIEKASPTVTYAANWSGKYGDSGVNLGLAFAGDGAIGAVYKLRSAIGL